MPAVTGSSRATRGTQLVGAVVAEGDSTFAGDVTISGSLTVDGSILEEGTYDGALEVTGDLTLGGEIIHEGDEIGFYSAEPVVPATSAVSVTEAERLPVLFSAKKGVIGLWPTTFTSPSVVVYGDRLRIAPRALCTSGMTCAVRSSVCRRTRPRSAT